MDVPLGDAPVQAQSRADGVYDALLRAIVQGTLAPGARLQEVALGEQLGVSRTPVREALRRLAEIDLVRLEVARHYHVTPLEPGRLRSIAEVYAELVGLATRHAWPELRPEDIAWIRKIGTRRMIDVLSQPADEVARPGSYGSDVIALVTARAADPVLSAAFVPYRPHVQRVTNLLGSAVEPADLAEWTGGILAAVAAGDGELFAESFKSYIRHAVELMLGAIDESDLRTVLAR